MKLLFYNGNIYGNQAERMIALSNNRNKKNKTKLAQNREDLDIEKLRKARKNASGKEEKAKIKAAQKEAKAKVKEREKKHKAQLKEKKLALREQKARAKEDELTQLKLVEDKKAETDSSEESRPDVYVPADTEIETASEESVICCYCFENEAEPGKDYCKDCGKALLRTKIPVSGWVAALVMIIFSFCGLVTMGLLSAASLQTFKADYYMSKDNFTMAFNAYDEVSSVLADVNSGFSENSVFNVLLKTGSNFGMKAMNCAAKIYGPLDAGESFDANIFNSAGSIEFKEHSRRYKKFKSYTDNFESTVKALDPVLAKLNEKAGEGLLSLDDLDAAIPEFETYIGKENVNEVYLYYTICVLAEEWCAADNDQLFKYMQLVDEAAKRSDDDYSWLYYKNIISMLMSQKKYDEATKYIMEMMNKDRSEDYSRMQLCRILVSRGKIDEAQAIVDEFLNNNFEDDHFTEDGYALQIYLERVKGNYENAIHLATDAGNYFTNYPEVRRQLALVYLYQGYYEEAFATAFSASNDASYLSSYYAITDFDGTLIDTTLYIATHYAQDVIDEDNENYEDLQYAITTFNVEEYVPDYAKQLTEGKFDLKKVLSEGMCDFI